MRVQPHLKKCFEGIYTLEFNAKKEIVGIISSEGEVVRLSSSIQPADAKVFFIKALPCFHTLLVEYTLCICLLI